MSYLVYCILNGHRYPPRPSPTGVRAQVVWVLECDDLCAAVSDGEAPSDPAGRNPSTTPQLGDLLAYAKAVQALNRDETVVPMRYGCFFRDAAEVRAWMRKSAAQLRALLRRLDGCVEMGVRALLPETGPPATAARSAAAAAARPGAAYLSARRVELALAQHCDRVAQAVRESLCGRFCECVTEVGPRGRGPTVSLYFLVERSRLAAFREAFTGIAAAEAALMLSGPWPPYNFVCGAAAALGDEQVPIRALR
jgi:Gas vesicle synthesis protein GvpL/GvpF